MERSARLVNKNIISKYTLTSNAKGSQKYDLFWLNPTCCCLLGTISGLLEASSRDVRRWMANLTISVSYWPIRVILVKSGNWVPLYPKLTLIHKKYQEKLLLYWRIVWAIRQLIWPHQEDLLMGGLCKRHVIWCSPCDSRRDSGSNQTTSEF